MRGSAPAHVIFDAAILAKLSKEATGAEYAREPGILELDDHLRNALCGAGVLGTAPINDSTMTQDWP